VLEIVLNAPIAGRAKLSCFADLMYIASGTLRSPGGRRPATTALPLGWGEQQ